MNHIDGGEPFIPAFEIEYPKPVVPPADTDFESIFDGIKSALYHRRHQGDPYTEDEVSRRLNRPDGNATGHALRDPVDLRINDIPQYEMPWMAPTLHVERIRVGRKVYKGPTYHQFLEPTCAAWAVVHAMNAANIPPSVPLAQKLLNTALPSEASADDGGMSIFDAAGIVHESDDAVDFRIAPLDAVRGEYSPTQVSGIVCSAIDDGSGLVAVVNRGWDVVRNRNVSHAVGIVGYQTDHDGGVAFQVADSSHGENAFTPRYLAHEMSQAGRLAPALAIISPR